MSKGEKNVTLLIEKEGFWKPIAYIGKKCQERFLPLNIPEAQPLQEMGIILGGISRLEAPYRMCRVPAIFHLLLFTLSGKVPWASLEKQSILEPGKMYFFPSGTIYQYWVDPPTKWQIIWFHFKDQSIVPNSPEIKVFEEPEIPRLKFLVQGYLDETLSRGGNIVGTMDASLAYAKLLAIFLERKLRSIVHPKQFHVMGQIRKLTEELENNLTKLWTVDEMARYIHVSNRTLNRIFREKLNQTPSEYLWKLRLNKAKGLLLQTNFTLDQIAELCGFSSGFSLSRALKREYGMSPKDIRKQLWTSVKEEKGSSLRI